MPAEQFTILFIYRIGWERKSTERERANKVRINKTNNKNQLESTERERKKERKNRTVSGKSTIEMKKKL